MQVQVQVGDTRSVFHATTQFICWIVCMTLLKRDSQRPICNVNEQLILYFFFSIFNKTVLKHNGISNLIRQHHFLSECSYRNDNIETKNSTAQTQKNTNVSGMKRVVLRIKRFV